MKVKWNMPNKVRLILVVLFLTLLSPTMRSQSMHRIVSWKEQRTPVSIPEQKLVVDLSDLASSGDWYLGAHLDSSASPRIVAAEAQFDSPVNELASLRILSSVSNWPLGKILTTPGFIRISGIGKAQGALMIHVTLPPGTLLEVDTNGQSRFSSALGQDIAMKNGTVVGSDAANLGRLISLAKTSSMKPAPDLQPLTNGEFVASLSYLSAHMIAFTKPNYPTGASTTNGQPVVVTFGFRVGVSGNILQVVTRLGSGAWAQAVTEAVQNWRFSPFEQNSQPVVVEGVSFCAFFPLTKEVKCPMIH